MNIVLINHYAGSIKHGMEFRPYYLSREWVKNGHQVTIIASSETHLRSSINIQSGLLKEEWLDGIRYIWLKNFRYRENGFGRIFNIILFLIQLILWGRTIIIGKPDVIIASSTYPLDIYPAYYLASVFHSKLVYELHDLWPLTPMQLNNLPWWHPYIYIMQKAEDFYCKHVDLVVSILPLAYNYLISRGLDVRKYTSIPNGVDIDGWHSMDQELPDSSNEIIENHRKKGNLLIGYAGAHGIANSLDTVVKAAETMKDCAVSFFLIGDGPEKKRLNNYIQEHSLQNVVLLPSCSKNCIPSFFNKMDVLYIGLAKCSLFQYGISPNKLFDYMMSGKVIIQAIEAGNDIVGEAQCGITIPSGDSGSLAEIIKKKILNMSYVERNTMGARGFLYVKEFHNYKYLAKQFIEVLERI